MHRVTNCCKSDTGKIGILPGLNSFIICATGKERTVFLRILRNKAVLLGAQRRKATLLFCDVGLTVTRCRRQPFVQAYPRVPSVQRKGPWDPAERAGGGHMADAASPSYHPGGCTIHAIFQDNCSHCREPKRADPRLTANARTDDLALADEYEARGVPISAMLEESEARADSARDQALADASPRASVRAAALLARVSSVVSLAQPDPGLAVRDDPECEMSRPAPCEMIPGDEYEVQAVIDHRDGAHGQTEYRVAWVGYPDEEQDTWEPSQNLTEHAGEILTAYEARLPPRRRQPTAAAISGRGRGLGRGRARGRGRGRARGRGRRPGPAKTTLNAAKLNENYKWCTTATHDCGELGDRKCVHCRALLYTSEVASHSPLLGPGYNRGKSCCADGKVVVPAIKFDPEIGRLFQDASQEVHQTPGSIMVAHARKINNALSMASLKIDEVFPGRGHYNPGLTIRGK